MNDEHRNTETLTIRVTPAQMIKLVDTARQTDRSLAYVVRKLIDTIPSTVS